VIEESRHHSFRACAARHRDLRERDDFRLEDLRERDDFRLDDVRLDDLREDDLRDGTLSPSRRASLRPIAMACLRLVTLRPLDPERSVPCLRSRITFSTFFWARGPYFAMMEPPAAVVLQAMCLAQLACAISCLGA
jgi:hypothetical protein